MGFFGVVLGGDRQREEKKTQFIVFCQPHKTPSGSKKKEENKRVGAKTPNVLELSLSVLPGLETGPFIFKTQGIVNKMVRDIGVF